MIDILSLLGGGLGAVARVVPEVFKMIDAKDNRKHELSMSKLQLDIDLQRSKQAIDMVHAQGSEAEVAGNMSAYIEALKAQGQRSGVAWIDGLNTLVRPMGFYYFMLLLGVYKIAVIYNAWAESLPLKDIAPLLWSSWDMLTLSSILSFFYVDRVFRKHAGK